MYKQSHGSLLSSKGVIITVCVHFTPKSFHPISFHPISFHPTFISPHVHFTPHSFHPTFISPHILISQMRLRLITLLTTRLWTLPSCCSTTSLWLTGGSYFRTKVAQFEVNTSQQQWTTFYFCVYWGHHWKSAWTKSTFTENEHYGKAQQCQMTLSIKTVSLPWTISMLNSNEENEWNWSTSILMV